MRRRLDAELVRRGVAGGRDEAKRLIAAGAITVDGSPFVKPATLVSEQAAIELVGDEPSWASRAAHKLAYGLSTFGVETAGVRALDVGASTGGFTDVLLEAGAAGVTAVDVGYGQMIWRLSQDPRVSVVDRTNFRTVDVASLNGPFDLVVVDVSFISIRLLASQLATAGTDSADYVVLVKPQFEVGKGLVGRGGIVTNTGAQAAAIADVVEALAGHGLGALAAVASPITGSKGNREFLLHARRGAESELDPEAIAGTVAR